MVRRFLLPILGLSVVAMGFVGKAVLTQGKQPIKYSHRIHVEAVGLTCLDCHVNAETGSMASIPNIELCGDCHDDVEAENPEIKKVAQFGERAERIPWLQIHRVPDHVYFSHRRHVSLGQVECEVCHGKVSEMDEPFEKPFVTIEMSWCIRCHETRAVSTDCATCHR